MTINSQDQAKKSIGILGGTFDPIHAGHLHIAKEVMQQISLDKIFFVPCYKPPHRDQPSASAEQRMAMVELAIRDYPDFLLDSCEIDRGSFSYMIDTAKTFRIEYPENSLSLILGDDAYQTFTSWRDWKSILNYLNLIVVNRSMTAKQQKEIPNTPLQQQETRNKSTLLRSKAGIIFRADIVPSPLSATTIRHLISKGESIKGLVPEEVISYIQAHDIYRFPK